MPPALALQALSFVLHGGTYFPPAAIMVGASGKTAPSGSGKSAGREPGADDDLEQLNRLSRPVIEPSADQRQASIPFTRSVEVAPSSQDHFGTSSGDLIETSAFKNEIKAALPLMTERQRAVLLCLCQGDPNKVIGRKLGMTETTVKVHVREIMRKLGVVNRTQVAIAAGRNGLVGNGDLLLAGEDTPEGSD
jgi:DNA-binding NarL/FixJ family response regulator